MVLPTIRLQQARYLLPHAIGLRQRAVCLAIWQLRSAQSFGQKDDFAEERPSNMS